MSLSIIADAGMTAMFYLRRQFRHRKTPCKAWQLNTRWGETPSNPELNLAIVADKPVIVAPEHQSKGGKSRIQIA
jgi:hypothetical protein